MKSPLKSETPCVGYYARSGKKLFDLRRSDVGFTLYAVTDDVYRRLGTANLPATLEEKFNVKHVMETSA